MTRTRQTRKSLLDTLAHPGEVPASPPRSMMGSNLALRAARDAVDGHQVWELDPADIIDERLADRLDSSDIADLRDSIETNGQTVPIFVRRDPEIAGRYLLIYGRRRLEAVRASAKIDTIRALVANLNDDEALQAQVTENTARRDLSFIERALFAHELVKSGLGSQTQVAELLNVPKSTVSTAIKVVDIVGMDLARAIGPALGIGRPRWEAVANCIASGPVSPEELVKVARKARLKADSERSDTASMAAFEAVARSASAAAAEPRTATSGPAPRKLRLAGKPAGTVRTTAKGVRLDIEVAENGFTKWIESEADSILKELHDRWAKRSEV